MNFNKSNVGDWRRRRALVSAFSVAPEGPTNALCLSASGIELFLDLRVIISGELALIGGLLVAVNRNESFPIDHQFN